MKIKVIILISVVLSTYLLFSCQSPVSFGEAVAIWHLSDLNDQTEGNSILQIRGEVPFVELKGDEAPLRPIDGKLQLRILVDRTCIEVYGNDGEVVLTSSFMPKPDCREYFFLADNQVTILNAKICKLNSIW